MDSKTFIKIKSLFNKSSLFIIFHSSRVKYILSTQMYEIAGQQSFQADIP